MTTLAFLSKKIKGEIKGAALNSAILGVASNSKQIEPGFLFIAKRGAKESGKSHIPEALEKGAVALALPAFDPEYADLPQLIHPDIDSLEAFLASHFYEMPSRELFVVGITGTKGKTTTAFLVKQLLDHFLLPSGLIGTVEYWTGKRKIKADRTTPDVIANQRLLREMVDADCRAAVMEVSSHGLDQGRVSGIHFDVAVFTNLTPEHLDYHFDMNGYCKAKSLLFSSLSFSKWAVVNQDSPWTPLILEGCRANCLFYGIDAPSDLKASQIEFKKESTTAFLEYEGRKLLFSWPLTGRYNVYNVLAAISVLLTKGIRLEMLVEPLKRILAVPGRLEKVENPLGVSLFVDYAHTEDAIKNVLLTLNEVYPKGKKIVVVGCGGERDHLKRPAIASTCEELADHVVLTSDNPRSEDKEKIYEDMVAGLSVKASFEKELDRRKAIEKAIRRAGKEDIVLIAGKGHETHQIIDGKTLPFDDKKVALEICQFIKDLS